MKLTDIYMLTEVVKRGSKYGWENTKVFDINDISDETKDNFESKHSYDDMARIAVAVLIADHAFMKMYGNETVCDIYINDEKYAWCEEGQDCNGCPDAHGLPASLYHAIEALKLLHAGENAIKYLYDTLPSVK